MRYLGTLLMGVEKRSEMRPTDAPPELVTSPQSRRRALSTGRTKPIRSWPLRQEKPIELAAAIWWRRLVRWK